VGGYIFMINSHNELLCLTRDHGQVVWVRKLESNREHPYKVVWNGPLVAGNKLYLVSLGGDLISVDPTNGNILSSLRLEVPFSLPPFIAHETLYLLSDDGEVMAFK